MRSNKIIFSMMLLFLLLSFLTGCLPGITPSDTGTISGRVMAPTSESSKDITGWVSVANATVTLVDAEGVTHTVTTDEDGYYIFSEIAVDVNTVIIATATIDGHTVVLKDVVSQAVASTEDYDAGTMDAESTALGLVIESLVEEGRDPGDIDLEEIYDQANFQTLTEQVSSVLEETGNVTTNPEVSGGVDEIVDVIMNSSPSSPASTKKNITNTVTLTYTEGEDISASYTATVTY